jgi:F0F1-type ATP synthase assembly protein I
MSGGDDSGEEPGLREAPPGRGTLPKAYDVALRWALTLAVTVLIGFWAGRWLDTKLHTTPLFILIGLFWGLAGSFLSLFFQMKRMQEKEKQQPK